MFNQGIAKGSNHVSAHEMTLEVSISNDHSGRSLNKDEIGAQNIDLEEIRDQEAGPL